MRRVQINIRGRVQGVAFRHNTWLMARKLGLKGYVKNLSDGSVEVVAEGPDPQVAELVDFCQHGSPGSTVQSCQVNEQTPQRDNAGFEIR